MLLTLAFLLLLQDELIDRLLSEDSDAQKQAATELVKQGKKARKALVKKRRKIGQKNRPRIDDVILRIDAKTDDESGAVADIIIHLDTSHWEIEFQERVKKKMIHITVPMRLQNDTGADVTVVLKEATFVTYSKKVTLLVQGADRKHFSWTATAGKVKDTAYHSFLTPGIKDGTLALVALEFQVGKKTLRLRTPVGPVTTKD